MFEDLPPSLSDFFSAPAFFTLVEDMTGMVFWLFLPEEKEIYLSQKLVQDLGTGSEKLALRDFLAFFASEEEGSFLLKVQDGCSEGQTWSEILNLSIHGHQAVPCRIWAKVCETQGTACYLGGIKDIGKGKARGDYRKVLSQVVEHTSEGIIITDPQGKTVYVNKGFEQLTGYSSEEMLGYKPGEKLQGPETSQDTIDFISQRLRENKSFSCEVLNYHKDGHTYWIRLAVHPRFNKHGELTHYMAIETDISGERMVQEALKVQQASLHREIEHRLRLEKELRRQAQNDPLTGIANRRYFIQEFHKEIERADRYARPLSLVMFDIDYFKRVNDTFGHGTGDMVLKWVSNKTAKQLRSHDFMARVGGEEFIIMLPDTNLENAFQLAQRLRAGFSETALPAGTSDLQITCSYGVAQWIPEEKSNLFLERVDKLLYVAKGGGRNMVVKEDEVLDEGERQTN